MRCAAQLSAWPHRFCLLTVNAQPIRGARRGGEIMSVQAGTRVDWRALWASGDLFRFCFVSLGILLHATNETMIATIMPAMVGDLSGVELVGWSLAVYELGAISAGAAAGRLVSYVPLRTNMVVAALLLRRRRADLRGGAVDADIPARPADRRAGRRRAGVARLRLGRAAVRARHLAAAVRRHVGDLGRRRLCRPAVRGAGRRDRCPGAGRSGCSRSPASPWRRRASWC